MESKLQNQARQTSKNPSVPVADSALVSKSPFAALLRQRHNNSQIHLSQLHKIAQEQRCQIENLRSVSLLFYLPIILMLFYFWL
ncbi:MAG TPA: hypothetical protein VF268_03915 [Gammaproteobacteria bacterium]